MNWNIKAKSTAVLIVAFVMVFGVGAYGDYQLAKVNREAADIRDNWMPAMKELGEIKFLITRIRFFAARRLITTDPRQTARLKIREASLEARLKQAIEHYEKSGAEADQHKLWDRFRTAWSAYLVEEGDILRRAAEGSVKAATIDFNTSAAQHFDNALAFLDADIELKTRGSLDSVAQAQAAYENALWVTAAVTGLALAFLLAIGALVSRDILTPLLRVTRAMQKLASGDLEIGVPFANRRDEIGAMADQLQVFRTNLIARRAAEAAAEARSRKQLESERKYREVFDNVSDSIFIFEVTNGIFTLLDMNPAAEKLAGASKRDVAGRNFDPGGLRTTGVEEMARQMSEPLQSCVEAAAPLAFEKTIEFPSGSRILHTTLLPVRLENGAIYRLIAFNRDVTKRKRAENEVRTLNRELEARVAQRTSALEQANRELESFAYSVSHDLRTPLRAIEGFSAILLAEHKGQLNDEGQRCLTVIRRGAQRVAKLIDDLLDYSFLLRRPVVKEVIDVGALAQMVFDELRAAEPARDIRLRLGDMPPAMGDRCMIRQALACLLSNAIKFTAPCAEALVEISGVEGETQVSYTVKDNGVGFDMRYVDKLFGVFQRLHGVDEFEGTGIGLATVKRIIEIHGGTVLAESSIGEGAVIHFTLPKVENGHGRILRQD
jgi:PAS domain S-box-containing protein